MQKNLAEKKESSFKFVFSVKYSKQKVSKFEWRILKLIPKSLV